MTLFVVGRGVGPRSDVDVLAFGVDTLRASGAMAGPGSGSFRSEFHPLFVLLTRPPTLLLAALGASDGLAVQAVSAGFGGVLACSVFLVARDRSLPMVSCTAVAALATVAAASVVFFAIPETFGVSAATAGVVLVIVGRWRTAPELVAMVGVLVLGAAAGLQGLLLPLVAVLCARGTWERRLGAIALAGALGSVLVALQYGLFGTRLGLDIRAESDHVRQGRIAAMADTVRTAALNTWVAPRARGVPGTMVGATWSPAPAGWTAVALVISLWSMVAVGVRRMGSDPLVAPVLAAVAGHVIFFSFYGDEAFLYSAGFVPLGCALVCVALTDDRYRRPITVCLWALAPVLLIVNAVALSTIG